MKRTKAMPTIRIVKKGSRKWTVTLINSATEKIELGPVLCTSRKEASEVKEAVHDMLLKG